MTARWFSEHRRLLASTIVIVLLVAVALATFGRGSSAAPSRRPAPAITALAASRQELAEQAQVKQLQTLTSRQLAEISSLKAQLQALGHPQPHSHSHRRR